MKWASIFLAVAFLIPMPAMAAATFPWSKGDKPPPVAGIALGDKEQHVLDVLGAPDDVNATGDSEKLQYVAKGLEITAFKSEVVAIRLLKPEAGSIGDLKVGDEGINVLGKWGAPFASEGRTAMFGNGFWMVAVQLADKDTSVVELTLAYITQPDKAQQP